MIPTELPNPNYCISAPLEARWDALALEAVRRNWHKSSMSLSQLAEKAGMPWNWVRGDEPLADFLAKNGSDLKGTHGFGMRKAIRLCDIIDRALGLPQESRQGAGGRSGVAEPLVELIDPRKRLEQWGIPLDFPCRLIRLPTRIIHHADELKISELGQLIDLWKDTGATALFGRRNLGKSSVESFSRFMNALAGGDRAAAAGFLPLHESGKGLSLRAALQSVFGELKEQERLVLERRLLQGMTLDRSTEIWGVSRERGRQVVRNFVCELQEWIGWFAYEDASNCKRMPTAAHWLKWIGPLDFPRDDALLNAALLFIFEEV